MIVSLLVGILVTLIASMRPAIRATRVPPIAAVREGATLPESRFARHRTLGSAAVTVLGFAAMLYGLFGTGLGTTGVLLWMGLGALLIFVGVAMLSVRVIRPLAAALGWPATRLGGAAGMLARDNAQRNPQRTASTAAALMIGLALVTLVAVLAAGITSSFRGAVNKHLAQRRLRHHRAEQLLADPDRCGRRGREGAWRRGCRATSAPATRRRSARASSQRRSTPPGATMFKLDWTEGSTRTIATLGDDGAFVDKGYAKKHHLQVGSTFQPDLLERRTQDASRCVGIFDPPPGGSPFGSVTISQNDLGRVQREPAEHLLVRPHEGRSVRREPRKR